MPIQRTRHLLAALALLGLAACATTPAAPAAAPAAPAAPPAAEATPKPQADSTRIPIGDSPVRGPDDALVTLVVISDFECPFCSRVTPTLEKLREHYGNDLRIVFKHNPLSFHPHAELAAEAAEAAHAQGRFWEMHDLLFQNSRALGREDLERYATNLGLDLERFRADLEQHVHLPRVRADQALAERLGAAGTPSFFINGTAFVGAQPYENFVAVIDTVLAAARFIPDRSLVYARMAANPLPSPRSPSAAPSPAPRRDEEGTPEIVNVPVNPKAPFIGGRDAKVVIEHFSDFECPFCARVSATIKKISETYGDKVRIVWRDKPLPFHANAHLAAQAAREMLAQKGNAGFWRFHDTLLQNQRALTRADLERYAQEQGADMKRFRRALDERSHASGVDADSANADSVGVQGTPTSFVNGRIVLGAQPFEVFSQAIDAALAAP
ncbi:thioredoxin domain-containing protein [Archangium gephyra]|uniref:DsbA family protein n=1 Tax=Archangium gephyra TaxID=48 RepID=UPI0035D4958C